MEQAVFFCMCVISSGYALLIPRVEQKKTVIIERSFKALQNLLNETSKTLMQQRAFSPTFPISSALRCPHVSIAVFGAFLSILVCLRSFSVAPLIFVAVKDCLYA